MSGGFDWFVLLHQVPPQPPYARAKVLRRLHQIGALPLKRAAYFLPATETTTEDLHWVRAEILEAGGEAWVFGVTFVAGFTADDAREAFRAARAADYSGLAEDARRVLEAAREATPDLPQVSSELSRLERRLAAIRRIDFFDAAGREEVETLMQSIKRTLRPDAGAPDAPRSLESLKGRRWMTRPGVRVDRIASAWLIRRFIDPAAVFLFGDGVPPTDAIRFDTYEGEFTHEGDRCTFEVLLAHIGRSEDPGLAAIGEIVHDLDLKDDRYQRPETAGFAAMLDGLIARQPVDAQRLSEGALLFESLYDHFTRRGA